MTDVERMEEVSKTLRIVSDNLKDAGVTELSVFSDGKRRYVIEIRPDGFEGSQYK